MESNVNKAQLLQETKNLIWPKCIGNSLMLLTSYFASRQISLKDDTPGLEICLIREIRHLQGEKTVQEETQFGAM